MWFVVICMVVLIFVWICVWEDVFWFSGCLGLGIDFSGVVSVFCRIMSGL